MNVVLKHRILRYLPSPTCNCRNPGSCPLDQWYMIKSVIYETSYSYIGLCRGEFKNCYVNHMWRIQVKKSEVKWASHVLKSNARPQRIKWKIVEKFTPHVNGSKKYKLCMAKRTRIFFRSNNSNTLLKSRSEIFSGCKHMARFQLT